MTDNLTDNLVKIQIVIWIALTGDLGHVSIEEKSQRSGLQITKLIGSNHQELLG
jgi:hypothetical protein